MNSQSTWPGRGNWQGIDSTLGMPGTISQAIQENGVAVTIYAPANTVVSGNTLPSAFVLQNPVTTIYAMILTDQEAIDTANGLMIVAPRVAFAYIQGAAIGMLFNRGLLYDGTNYWLMHQSPVPYPIDNDIVGYRVLVTQQQQIPAGIPGVS